MVRPRSKSDRPKGREKESCDNLKPNFPSASVGAKTRSAGADPADGSFFLPDPAKQFDFYHSIIH